MMFWLKTQFLGTNCVINPTTTCSSIIFFLHLERLWARWFRDHLYSVSVQHLTQSVPSGPMAGAPGTTKVQKKIVRKHLKHFFILSLCSHWGYFNNLVSTQVLRVWQNVIFKDTCLWIRCIYEEHLERYHNNGTVLGLGNLFKYLFVWEDRSPKLPRKYYWADAKESDSRTLDSPEEWHLPWAQWLCVDSWLATGQTGERGCCVK